MRSSVLAVFAVPVLASSALPQTVPSPSFEVASIKPAAPDARGMFIRPGPGGGVSITNISLKELELEGTVCRQRPPGNTTPPKAR
jgi:hypothetical protein